jgi:hypothetical protein
MIAWGKEVPQRVIDAGIAAMKSRAEFLPVDIRDAINAAWGAELPELERSEIVRIASRNLIDLESRAGRIDLVRRGVYRCIAE